MASKYKKHKEKWSSCSLCKDLCKTRKKVVLVRGKLPADILFLGEAPGASEDVVGVPFIGPAGKLLDRIIAQALGDQFTYAFTNLIACIPKGEDGNKIAEPTDKHIMNCAARLGETVKLVKPSAIVLVGKLAEKWGIECVGKSMATVSIIHPAAILRMDVDKQGLAVKRCVIALEDMVDD